MILYHNITEESFGLAFELASKRLAAMDLNELCKKTGAIPIDDKRVMLNYLNRHYLIDIINSHISPKDEEEGEIPFKDKILILHYLTQAKGTPFTNRLITYAQIQGGRFYCPVFQKRTVEPILRCFGKDPEKLLEISRVFNGSKAPYGDASVKLDPFPMVRFFIILWRGDDEIPPNGNILFDKNITDYLSAEDIAVLSETIIWKLINFVKS